VDKRKHAEKLGGTGELREAGPVLYDALPDPTLTDAAAKLDIVSNTIAIHRWWLARLFGQRIVEFERDGNGLTVRTSNAVSKFELDKITVNAQLGQMVGQISISATGRPNTSVKFKWLNKDEVKRALQDIFEWRFGETIPDAHQQFKSILASPGYLNRSKVVSWYERYRDLHIGIYELFRTNIKKDVGGIGELFATYEQQVTERNDLYVENMASLNTEFFKDLESYPRTNSQIEAILRDEDNCLVVAGAGTGKTSTVVGKISYLLEKEEVKEDEILALAFTRKAAEEMRERVKEITDCEVEIRTFHSLGRSIVLDAENEKPTISDMAGYQNVYHGWISSCLLEMLKEPEARDNLINLVVYHRYPARYLDSFDKRGHYLEYLRKTKPETLRTKRVKSFEELLIADWLTINGVTHKYEYPYEVKTAKRQKRQYRPDFYLPEYGIYLEHFGIDRQGNTAPDIDAESYNKQIRWKRDLHNTNGTKLIESYSWERMEGVLLQNLAAKLDNAGVKRRQLTDDELREIVEHPNVKRPLVALLGDFLKVFKENLWTIEEVRNLQVDAISRPRTTAFLDVFEEVYKGYEKRLEERQELDFADLIVRATHYIESSKSKLQFKRIIVDEFQDISRGRLRLIQALLKASDRARFFCVGDDWQSIYGFTGSDVGIITSFADVFGFTCRVDLEHAFRFNQEVLEASSLFIQKNPAQLSKKLIANHSTGKPVIHIKPGREPDLRETFKQIDKKRKRKSRASVLVLGRYNFVEPSKLRAIADSHSMLDVEFLTVHKAKGLEADFVVILDANSGTYGFPSEIASDELIDLVAPSDVSYKYAEERRVFYVALTRARQSVYVCCDESKPSSFVDELLSEEYTDWVSVDGSNLVCGVSCPACDVGHMVLKYPNRPEGYAWRCISAPYCDGRAKMCPSCKSSPLIGGCGGEVCQNPSCENYQLCDI